MSTQVKKSYPKETRIAKQLNQGHMQFSRMRSELEIHLMKKLKNLTILGIDISLENSRTIQSWRYLIIPTIQDAQKRIRGHKNDNT